MIKGDRREADFCGNALLYSATKVGKELCRTKLSVQMSSGIRDARVLESNTVQDSTDGQGVFFFLGNTDQ